MSTPVKQGTAVPSIPPLRPAQLREPLLKALSKVTHGTPNTFVANTEVLDLTIREAGYDPDNLPAGWDRKRRSGGGSGAGLDRNISLAFRYAYRDKKPALTIKGPKPGLWGLTEAGVALAASLVDYSPEPEPEPRPLPRPKIFYDPLMRVLGNLSGHRADVAFPHSDVIFAVMRDIGVDPDNLPAGWGERGSNRQIKAFDRVRWAVKSLKGAKDPLIGQPKRGFWCLTESGVEAAKALNGVKDSDPPQKNTPSEGSQEPQEAAKAAPTPTRPNETARWLGRHCRHGSELYRKMERALSRRLPVSASSGMIEDHIQNFLVRAIKNNSLRKLIAAEKVPYSKVVAYCVNSGRTDARDAGTDPVMRTFYGARTEKERRERRDDTQFEDCGHERALDSDGNIIGEDTTSIDETEVDFDLVWAQIENVVHDRKPQAWQRYASILAMKAKGYSTKEIAKAEGVSRNRAAWMIAEARRCVREGYADGDLVDFLN